jgi:hypothetical protein
MIKDNRFKVAGTVAHNCYFPTFLQTSLDIEPKVKEVAGCGGKFMQPTELRLFLGLPLCNLGKVTCL